MSSNSLSDVLHGLSGVDNCPVDDLLVLSGVDTFPTDCASSNEHFVVETGDEPREWFPTCIDITKPTIGMRFDTLQDGILFYQAYAHASGFSTRLRAHVKFNLNKDIVWHQHVVCNRQGFNTKNDASTSRERQVTRCNCKAKFVLKLCVEEYAQLGDGAGYLVHDFHEGHSHTLAQDIRFEKGGRKMTPLHKLFIMNNARNGVGPSKSFRLFGEHAGGVGNVGPELIEFKNFHREVKVLIKEPDPQMFIDNFKRKREMWSSFYYDYEVDADDCLNRVFWCDPFSIKNYHIFGDVVSFDTTFSSNKYHMVFGLFTGLDNHHCCVTFGACLIAKEDIPSFVWVFTTFLKAMDGREPTYLITDQDPAMDRAFPRVFKEAQHRFCLWHIMKKLPDKIGRDIVDDFLEEISSCVWTEEIEPEVFESEWNRIVGEFKLQDHDWLSRMYRMKHQWIPAYFRDLHLGGLLSTTSISESQNKAFTSFTSPLLTLVEFYSRFESNLDYQRHKNAKNEYESDQKHPKMLTDIRIEEHAAKIYTANMFRRFVQPEIIESKNCGFTSFPMLNGDRSFGIAERESGTERESGKNFNVMFDSQSQETSCSCKLVVRKGYPCRHMFWVWNASFVSKIPDQYITKRWCKDITTATRTEIDLDDQPSSMYSKKSMLQLMWSEILSCASVAQYEEAHISSLINAMRSVKKEILSGGKTEKGSRPLTKKQEVELLLGQPIPTELNIKPPKISKNKGTGVHVKGKRKDKRLLSDKEKAIASQENKRQCKTCKKYANHDSRNCPTKKGKQVAEDLEEMDDNDTSDCSN